MADNPLQSIANNVGWISVLLLWVMLTQTCQCMQQNDLSRELRQIRVEMQRDG